MPSVEGMKMNLSLPSLPLVALLALLAVSGCGAASTSDNPDAVASATASDPASSSATSSPDDGATDNPAGGAKATGDPRTDPCSLLTRSIAEKALGMKVGAPTTTPGEGNVTCSYSPADGRPNVFVLLTTYAASGKAALTSATKAFPDATAVPGLGDSALVSRKGHAIGVSQGDLIFGMSLLRPDSLDIAPDAVEAQLVAVARSVVESR
jgi:hypothetical protein